MRPRLGAVDRLHAWLVTGPLGRVAAFAFDLAAAWWRWACRRAHPERTR
ncbi:MAG TPA: hypothetical protein VK919_01040 [Solirubrobacterales bacterium]|nr:hypothetical protein [Solirubrobacterales bacterium]